MEEIESLIYKTVSESHKEGEVNVPKMTWNKEQFLLIAKTASERGWGMNFMGASHFLNEN